MSRTECVIFDLDGTLLDTESLYTEAAAQVCARYGKAYPAELKRRIMGGDTHRGAQIVVSELALPISPALYLREREEELYKLLPSARPMPGAERLIAALAREEVRLVIATSGHARITAHKLSFQPFLSAIELVVCGDDPRLTRGKPAPDIYLLAAGEIGITPERCLVIEDSLNGVKAGLAANMRTVALLDPRWGFDRTLFQGAEIIGSLAELNAQQLLAQGPL